MEKERIGIIGGGQLALMIGEEIKKNSLQFELTVLDPTKNCPAYPFADQIVGDFKDERLIRELAKRSSIVTYEIELAGSNVLRELEKEGKPVHPSPETLGTIQDKLVQYEFLRQHKIPVPFSKELRNSEEGLVEVINSFGTPVMIKSRKDSYDGRGNFVLRNEGQVKKILEQFESKELMAQRYVNFDKEVSVIAARSTTGEIKTYPVGENIHGKDYNILLQTIVPARIDSSIEKKAREVAENTLEAFKGAGVFGIEMFIEDDKVLVNEIAPRVHNSGHYTIEACITSQFENHLRAISGMELGSTDLIRPMIMYNIIGEEGYEGLCQIFYDGQEANRTTQEVAEGIYVHIYGKSARPQRKLGHVTILGRENETQDELEDRASGINNLIKIKAA